jgi:hypothetical protein
MVLEESPPPSRFAIHLPRKRGENNNSYPPPRSGEGGRDADGGGAGSRSSINPRLQPKPNNLAHLL